MGKFEEEGEEMSCVVFKSKNDMKEKHQSCEAHLLISTDSCINAWCTDMNFCGYGWDEDEAKENLFLQIDKFNKEFESYLEKEQK